MSDVLQVEQAREVLRLEPHPLIAPHTEEECREIQRLLANLPAEEAEELIATMAQREARIAQALADPLRHGIEPECWRDADTDLRECELQYVSGPNRSTKSYRAAKRLVE